VSPLATALFTFFVKRQENAPTRGNHDKEEEIMKSKQKRKSFWSIYQKNLVDLL
jgi:hypothetical protein